MTEFMYVHTPYIHLHTQATVVNLIFALPLLERGEDKQALDDGGLVSSTGGLLNYSCPLPGGRLQFLFHCDEGQLSTVLVQQ